MARLLHIERPSDLVRAEHLQQAYGDTLALRDASCIIQPGDRIALLGTSGSGKSTLLHLLGGLNAPSGGQIRWPALGDASQLRPGKVSFVFQAQSLLAPLTALENVALPLLLLDVNPEEAQERAGLLLGQLGLDAVIQQLPEELSGGQAQRVAVARALVTRPRLVLADEPTGQLDSVNAQHLMDVLLDACNASGAALIVATHDLQIARRLTQVWRMSNGVLAPAEVAA